MRKQLIIAWGAGYSQKHKIVTKPDDFFANNNGFDDDDIEAINSLEVALCYRADDMHVCTIMRLEDIEDEKA